MDCYHPIRAFQGQPGTPLYFGKTPRPGWKQLDVPCGQCIGCKLAHAYTWGVRGMHEASLNEENTFLTLTYDDQHLPPDLSLNKSHYDTFLKRLRERVRRWDGPDKPDRLIRHFMGGEYGERYGRPHYHAIIFNWRPNDQQFWKTTDAGHKTYTSKFLDDLWGHGTVFIGEVTQQSIAYIARYTLKKIKDGPKREILDVTTGQIITREHEYGQMSLKPGIGAAWVKKYPGDVYPHDRVIVNGQNTKVPKYYDKLLEKISPLYLAEIKAKRTANADLKYQQQLATHKDTIINGIKHYEYADPKRLKEHETVKLASIKLLKRE